MALGTSVSRGVGAAGIPIPQPPKKTATRLSNRVAATWPGGHRRAVSREGTRRALSGAQRPRLLLPPRKSDPITRPHVGSQHEGGNDAPLPSICPRRPRQEPFTDEKGAPRGPLLHSDQWLRSLDSNQGPSGYEFVQSGPRPSSSVPVGPDLYSESVPGSVGHPSPSRPILRRL